MLVLFGGMIWQKIIKKPKGLLATTLVRVPLEGSARKKWLSSDHMDIAQYVIGKQFPDIDGLQSTVVLSTVISGEPVTSFKYCMFTAITG